MCGKILGDIGADVVKIEQPGGNPARNIGPFYHDIPHPEKSLSWFASNTSKRGITLNIEVTDGQEIFKRLVKGADFVIESFPPGYLSGLGLDYPTLSEVNPRIIMVSIAWELIRLAISIRRTISALSSFRKLLFRQWIIPFSNCFSLLSLYSCSYFL